MFEGGVAAATPVTYVTGINNAAPSSGALKIGKNGTSIT